MTCATTTTYPTDADLALSGNWYAAATSGQGFSLEANPDLGRVFPRLVHLRAERRRRRRGSATVVHGTGAVCAWRAFAAVTLYETKGGQFDTPTPTTQTTGAVGTGTWTYQGCSTATFTYAFTGGTSSGRSGSIAVTRVGPVPPVAPRNAGQAKA